MNNQMTHDELARNDGRDDRPAYVAVEGRVYDVSASKMWKRGAHMNRHKAGNDLTADLSAAPHGTEVFQREGIRLVGPLAQEPTASRGPTWLNTLLDRFPMLHRHPHPMIVHFPMAYPAAASLFTALSFFGWAPFLFQRIAFAMLVLGVVSTPVGIATGFFTWWLNYQAQMVHHVKCKIVCSLVLFAVQLLCLGMKLGGLAAHGATAWVYSILMVLLLPNALLLGYHGGQLTFPYSKAKAAP